MSPAGRTRVARGAPRAHGVVALTAGIGLGVFWLPALALPRACTLAFVSALAATVLALLTARLVSDRRRPTTRRALLGWPAAAFRRDAAIWVSGGIAAGAALTATGARDAFVSTALLVASVGVAASALRAGLLERALGREGALAELPEEDPEPFVSWRVKAALVLAAAVLTSSVPLALQGELRARNALARDAVERQGRYLERAAVQLADGASLDALRREAKALGIATRLEAFAPEQAPLPELTGGRLHVQDALRGAGLGTRHVFAWRRLRDGRVLLAAAPRPSLGSVPGALPAAMWVAVALAVALGLATLLAEAVLRAAEAVRPASSGEPDAGLDAADELGVAARELRRERREREARRAARAAGLQGLAHAVRRAQASLATREDREALSAGFERAARALEQVRGRGGGITEVARELTATVEESSSSILELGAAGEQLNQTASVLSGRADEVSGSIERVVRSVAQVGENATSLADAATETAASVVEVASSLREVDANADEMGRLSAHTMELAERGHLQVRDTIEGMDAIRAATETAERVIRGLGTRADEIGAILDVIDDVADETNLLALNAAIIASQAGEHGRAFSVVADEIKELADRVLASTKEIGELIRGVQAEIENAMGAIERGSERVLGGVDLVAHAGVSLEQITRSARESGAWIAEIVTAVREQTRAAAHVAELVERVRVGVEQIRSASGEQERGNEVVLSAALAMRELAQQVHRTTEEQARGGGHIHQGVEAVAEGAARIHGALAEQDEACVAAAERLGELQARLEGPTPGVESAGEALRDALERIEELQREAADAPGCEDRSDPAVGGR